MKKHGDTEARRKNEGGRMMDEKEETSITHNFSVFLCDFVSSCFFFEKSSGQEFYTWEFLC